jgi:hypothetical protein
VAQRFAGGLIPAFSLLHSFHASSCSYQNRLPPFGKSIKHFTGEWSQTSGTGTVAVQVAAAMPVKV